MSMSISCGAKRRSSGVAPARRVRPSAFSTVCTRSSSARGGSTVSMATTPLRYQRRSPTVSPASASHGSDSYSGEAATTVTSAIACRRRTALCSAVRRSPRLEPRPRYTRGMSAAAHQFDARRAHEAFERRRELAHAHTHALDGELAEQRLRDGPRQPLDEVHASLGAHLHDAAGDGAVVDGGPQLVGDGGRGEVERELGVHREPDTYRLLGLGGAVMTVEAHVLEQQTVGHQSFTTVFRRLPMPSILTST